MSKDNLVPEQRPTKDGVLVTRWVRQDTNKSYASSSLPAPDIFHQSPESSTGNVPKKDAEESGQRAQRRTGNSLVMDYIQTESRLKLKYRDNPLVSDFAVSGVLKALRETSVEDPSSVVDADLLISYSEFTDLAWRTFNEHSIHSANEFSYSEIFRPQVTKLAAHYVTQPHERERLVGIVAGGVYDYDEAMNELNKLSLV